MPSPGPGRCKNPKAAPLGTRAVLGQTPSQLPCDPAGGQEGFSLQVAARLGNL